MSDGKTNQKSTKDSILKATHQMLTEEGAEKLTIRKIAARANVNIALINYYFKSKDNLIDEVLRGELLKIQFTFFILEDAAISPKERLKAFLKQYIKFVSENIYIIKKYVFKDGLKFESQFEFITFLKNMGFDKIKKILSEITAQNDTEKLTYMIFQMMGGIIFPLLVKPILDADSESEIFPPLNIDLYVDTLFNKYDE